MARTSKGTSTTTTKKSNVKVVGDDQKSTTKKKSEKKTAPKKKKKFDDEAFYKKYPHVVHGSIKEVKQGTKVDGIVAVHGRICQIKCLESGTLRTINVQDAFQVKYSVEVQKQKAKERATNRRKKKVQATKKSG